MFRSNCRAIFKLIFGKVECKFEVTFNIPGLVLQELVKIIVAYFIKNAQTNITTNYV